MSNILSLFRACRNEGCIANVRNPDFQLDAVACIRHLCAAHTKFQASMAISDEAESLGQPLLEPAIKHTSSALFYDYNSITKLTLSLENDPSPKKGGLMVSNTEQPLKIPMVAIDDEHKVQGKIGIPQMEGPLGGTYTTSQRPEIPTNIPPLL